MMSLYPSVWRDTGCLSHFILLRDQIYLFDKVEDWWDLSEMPSIDSNVLTLMKDKVTRTAIEISMALQEIPWDVIESCRRLTRQGKLKESLDDATTFYRLKE